MDSSVGFLIAFIAFMIPAKSFNFSLEHRLMEWKFIQNNMPWAIIFIIGGGSTLTEVVKVSSHLPSKTENKQEKVHFPAVRIKRRVAGPF